MRTSKDGWIKRNVTGRGNGHGVLGSFVVHVVVRRSIDRRLEGKGRSRQCGWRDQGHKVSQAVEITGRARGTARFNRHRGGVECRKRGHGVEEFGVATAQKYERRIGYL